MPKSPFAHYPSSLTGVSISSMQSTYIAVHTISELSGFFLVLTYPLGWSLYIEEHHASEHRIKKTGKIRSKDVVGLVINLVIWPRAYAHIHGHPHRMKLEPRLSWMLSGAVICCADQQLTTPHSYVDDVSTNQEWGRKWWWRVIDWERQLRVEECNGNIVCTSVPSDVWWWFSSMLLINKRIGT